MPSERAILYTRPDCSYSDALRHDLDKMGVTYDEIDVSVDDAALEELERLTGGEHITPVLVQGEEVTVGYYGLG